MIIVECYHDGGSYDENGDHVGGSQRVAKCQIFYTDQYQQTRFYPENIFGTSNLQNRTYEVSCDE